MPALVLVTLLLGCAKPDGDDTPTPPADDPLCAENGWPVTAWDTEGPFGVHRHELADDATIPLLDGTEWRLSDGGTGCDVTGFLTDVLPVSDLDDTSWWSADVDALLRNSPDNARWFFVTRQEGGPARRALDDMQAQIDAVLADLGEAERAHWADRLLVVDKPADRLGGWLTEVLTAGIGQLGFAIDRQQRLRGLGSMADVERYNGNPNGWPWDNNLAYAGYDLKYLNTLGELQAARDAVDATVIPLWTGEVISQYAEMDVALPDAATMASFDTFEIEVDMRCPDPNLPEFGNCGAWDYLAHLYVQDGDQWVELSRFITTYHREAWWLADATPTLPLLDAGGTRRFRWEWAPEWNVQPTETRLNLRFSTHGKPDRPVAITRLFTGGPFGAAYNDGRVPVDVAVPASASRVELWAVITGHGAGTDQCAEFCNHQHEFTVGADTFLHEHDTVGDDLGCVREWKRGMTPNQWGTWWFGRGGWCPGQDVLPYQVDVTASAPPGATTSVAYRGLLGGDDPPDGAGDILMNAWWVTYEARP